MEKEESSGGSMVVTGRTTIDTRPPFRSVKEAVALFGEKVLVGEIYAKQLKEMQVIKAVSEKENVTSALGVVSAELEETKQNLQKTREEGNYMANCLKSLKQELEETKREIQNLKLATNNVVKEQPKVGINPEIEEFKFVEVNHNHLDIHRGVKDMDDRGHHLQLQHEFQRKKAVTFASPPSLTREIKESHSVNSSKSSNERRLSKLGRTLSLKKEGKKKPNNVSIMGWLFPRKKRGFEGDHHHFGSPKN